jgi:hypothetical protein
MKAPLSTHGLLNLRFGRRTFAALLLCLVGLSGCIKVKPPHPLVGSWEASDGTVFVFRKDGTFVGRDYVNRRIFGNWVELDGSRIGFQTLMHTSAYAPQYAETAPGGMRYAYSDGSRFVNAKRLSGAKAMKKIAAAPIDKNNFR